jgi:hypothetical protein
MTATATDQIPDWKLGWNPKQWELWKLIDESPATLIGEGGSRGGSKSHSLRTMCLMRRVKYDRTDGLIFRRKLKDLTDNHIIPLLRQFPKLRRYYKQQDRKIYLPNGSMITFGYGEHYRDILDYRGKEYADEFIDEATHLTGEEIEELRGANRCTTNNEILCKMILAMNPGGPGHGYIKRILVDRNYLPNENPKDFAFLQTYGWDNVRHVLPALRKAGYTAKDYYSWPEKQRFIWYVTRSQYGRKQYQLPEDKRKADLFGDWNIFAGQFFSMFRHHIHVQKSFQPPDEWRMLGALDWGQRAVLEVAARAPQGMIVNFGEVYTEHEAATPRAIAIADFLLEKKLYRLDIRYDTNMDIDLSEVGYDKVPIKTVRQVLKEKMGDKAPLLTVVSKKTVDNRHYRELCNDVFKEYLNWRLDTQGEIRVKPKWVVTEDCPMLIQTLPGLQHPQVNPTGRDFDWKIGIADPFDAAKMALMSLLPPREIPKERPKEWFEEVYQHVGAETPGTAPWWDPWNV